MDVPEKTPFSRWADHPMITVTHARLLTRRFYDVKRQGSTLFFARGGQLVESLPIADDCVSRDAIGEIKAKALKESS